MESSGNRGKTGQDAGPKNTPGQARGGAAELFAHNLSAELSARGLSTYQLAAQTKMSERHLEDLVAGKAKRGPRPDTVARIAAKLGVLPEKLLPTDGSTAMVVRLKPLQRDVLHASAALKRSSVEEVLNDAVEGSLETAQRQPRVARILAIMNEPPNSDE